VDEELSVMGKIIMILWMILEHITALRKKLFQMKITKMHTTLPHQ
jgi:hypothetical protein